MTQEDARSDPVGRADRHSAAVADGPAERKRVAILGSTGSIGTQALDVIARNPDRFEVVALAARSNLELLAEQLSEWKVRISAVAGSDDDSAGAREVVERVAARDSGLDVDVASGADGLRQISSSGDVDIVLNAVVGSAGLGATLAALRAGKRLALANKESLVAGGDLVRESLERGSGELLPVDSEHAGLAQCMRSGARQEISRMYLTASGGPFRGYNTAELSGVTVNDALAHPTWEMGRKITVDSATLMNKGLESIEAHVLFDIGYDRIGIVVHPQSIVHAMVEFIDGSTICQMGIPNMEAPIGFALGAPNRLDDSVGSIDWMQSRSLTFEPVDLETFRCLKIALDAGREGGSAPAIMNAANEEAVAAFLEGKLPFVAIADAIEATLGVLEHTAVRSEEELAAVESDARRVARTHVARLGQN